MYQYDASYAVEVQQAHPGRIAIVKPVKPDEPAVADVIADWKETPGGRHPHHADKGGERQASLLGSSVEQLPWRKGTAAIWRDGQWVTARSAS